MPNQATKARATGAERIAIDCREGWSGASHPCHWEAGKVHLYKGGGWMASEAASPEEAKDILRSLGYRVR